MILDDERWDAFWRWVDGAIGEARRIEGVAWIDVKDEWDERQRPAARRLTVEGLRRALRGPGQR